MSLKIVIPLKTNSERVPNKNLRPFIDNQSLFDVKACQLLKWFSPDDVYVSSENPEVKEIVSRYGFHFHLRDEALTKSTAKENDIVRTLVSVIPGKPDIMWCQVTQPLFDEFGELIEIYKNLDKKYDSIAVVKKISHHILDANANPVNFNFGYWHKISQELPPLYEVTWSAFIMRRSMLEQAWYQIGRTPYLYETKVNLVDINSPEEFEAAQILYRFYSELKSK